MADPTATFEKALTRMIERSPAEALSIVTGAFVSLTLSLLRAQGHEPDGEVRINGGENRDITIHAAKKEAANG